MTRRFSPTPCLLATLAALVCSCAAFPRDSHAESHIAKGDSQTGRAFVDSLLWQDKKTSDFIREALGAVKLEGQANRDFGAIRFQYAAKLNLHKYLKTPNEFFAAPRSADTGWVYSPDSNRAAYWLRYLGEPDVDLELYDRRNGGGIAQLEFCTYCLYLGVRWLDDERFVFVKTDDYVDNRQGMSIVAGYIAYVSLYDLGIDSVYRYESSPVLFSALPTANKKTPPQVDSLMRFDASVKALIHKCVTGTSIPNPEKLHFSWTMPMKPTRMLDYPKPAGPSDTAWVLFSGPHPCDTLDGARLGY